MKFSIKDLFRKLDQICRKLRIWSHLLKKSIMENFIFCAVKVIFKQKAKHNNYWIFLILFVFTVAFFLELETREGWIVQRVLLYKLAATGHELTAIGKHAQYFNTLMS